MHLTDTHTHLYAEEFNDDRPQMIERALANGVNTILLPNIEASSIEPMKQLCAAYPKNCFPMMGLHPCSVKENYREELARVEQELFSGYKYYGVGEMGLDLYWDTTFAEQQKEAFIQQVQWAIQLHLPLSMHTRNATAEAIELLKLPQLQGAKGVFHCFSGTKEQAEEITGRGFHLGIGGVLTFKNAGLDKAIENIPLQYLVLETDAPYLAPVPYRGKRNESAYLLNIAQKLAEITGHTLQQVADITTQNARTQFGVG